jgi:uncharacterized protein YdhG (YjbR/CyaY superfamily)
VRTGAATVEEYLDEAPEDRRPTLTLLRDLARRNLAGFDESMVHGMPAYSRDGVAEVAWANQRRYVSLYVLRTDVLDAHRDRLAGLDVGKGCIRYRRLEQVDHAVVTSMMVATAASRGPVC